MEKDSRFRRLAPIINSATLLFRYNQRQQFEKTVKILQQHGPFSNTEILHLMLASYGAALDDVELDAKVKHLEQSFKKDVAE